MMIVMGVAPVIAPTLGAWLLLFFHWHAIFGALTLLGIVSLVWVIFGFKETLPVERRLKISFKHVFQLYLKIFKDPSYRFPMLAGCFSFGVLFCYINVASTILMDSYYLNEQQFAYAFGINAVGTMFLSAMNHKLEHKYSVLQRLRLGGLVQIAGVFLLLIASVLPQAGLVVVLAGLFMAVSGIGLTAPNSTALAMSKQGRQAGSASALMGGLQFFFGLLSGLILSFLPWSSLLNLSIAMLIFVLCANTAIWASERYFKMQPAV